MKPVEFEGLRELEQGFQVSYVMIYLAVLNILRSGLGSKHKNL